jgi:hypothetical protein
MATVLASASLACVNSTTLSAIVEYRAVSTLAGVSSATVVGKVTRNCVATISGQSSITGVTKVTHNAAASLASIATVSPPSSVKHLSVASIASVSAVTAAGVSTRLVSATLAAVSSITASTKVTHPAAASVTATSTITGNAKANYKGAASLAAISAITAPSCVKKTTISTGGCVIAGSVTLLPIYSPRISGGVVVAGTSSLSGTQNCSASVIGSSSIVAVANPRYFITGTSGCLVGGTVRVSLNRINTATGGVKADGGSTNWADHNVRGASGVLVAGIASVFGNQSAVSNLVGSSSVVSTATVKHNGTASLATVGSITAVGTAKRLVSAAVSGGSTATVNAVLVKLGVVQASGGASITAASLVTHKATTTLATVSSITANTKVTHNASAALVVGETLSAVGRVVAFFSYTGSGHVDTAGAAEYGYKLEMEGDGRISVMGEATVTRFYGDWSKCDENEIRGISLIPNKHKDCFRSRPFMPERRKHIPKSLKGTAAILPAITVSQQNYFLPE